MRKNYSKKIAAIAGICTLAATAADAVTFVKLDEAHTFTTPEFLLFDGFEADGSTVTTSALFPSSYQEVIFVCGSSFGGGTSESGFEFSNTLMTLNDTVGDTLSYIPDSLMLFPMASWYDGVYYQAYRKVVGADTYYGYGQFTVTSARDWTMTGYAFGDANEALTVSDITTAVPEPATYGFLGGSAILLTTLITRRKGKKAVS